MYTFEKLTVWHESLKLVDEVYILIRRLPKSEERGLADQLRRAALSIALNVAEGTGGSNRKSFASSVNVALRSQYETIAALKIIERLFGIKNEKAYDQAEVVGKLLHGLARSLKTDN